MSNMAETKIREKLLNILSSASKIKPSLDNLPEDFEPLSYFGIDSLGAVQLFLAIEEGFNIRFGSEFEDLESIGKFSTFYKRIEGKQNEVQEI